MHGYQGRILHVNLTNGQTHVETFDETFAQTYLGGNGFAIRLLYECLAPGIDPLAPDNMLVFGFGGMLNDNYPRLINAVTGWNLSLADVERIGERIWNLERAFNVREGVRRSQDVLPYRVMFEPVPEGMHQGMHCPPHELNAMLDIYYALRGWSPEGIPTPEKLTSLGLTEVVGPLG